MRILSHGDDALPTLSLACVIENRHGFRRLHNLKKKTGVTTKIWQDGGHATLPKATILWTVGAIDDAPPRSPPRSTSRPDRQIVRRRFRSSRGRQPTLPTHAAAQIVFANVCGLQEGQLKISDAGPRLLRLRRERRHSSVRRIHNQRRPLAHVFVCREDRRVVCAPDVLFAAPLANRTSGAHTTRRS